MSKQIHLPTAEEEEAMWAEVFEREKRVEEEHRLAAALGLEALERLAKVLCGRSGQPYKVRALLYSLWNGKPASLVEVVNLDWEIRQDLACVMLGFGYECEGQPSLFYKEIASAIKAVGQWEWFLEEQFNYEQLEEYAQSSKAAAQEKERGA